MEKYQYRVKKASEMTEKEFANCVHLFSVSYGICKSEIGGLQRNFADSEKTDM